VLGAPGVGAAVATPPSLGADGQRPRARSEAVGNGTISWGFRDFMVIYWGFSGDLVGFSWDVVELSGDLLGFTRDFMVISCCFLRIYWDFIINNRSIGIQWGY